jgi:hypothetical protein
MRVQSSLENRYSQANFAEPRTLRPADTALTPTAPGATRDATPEAPVEASTNARFASRRPPATPSLTRRARAKDEDFEPSSAPGFTQAVEGSKPSPSFDRLDISTEARRMSADEGRRASADQVEAAKRNGTQNPAVTTQVATMLDVRV